MINPTFASFKSTNQSHIHTNTLTQINNNIQPKSFYQLKSTNNINKNIQQDNHHYFTQPIQSQHQQYTQHMQGQYGQQKISFNNLNQNKKPVINFNLKKNYSQAIFVQVQNRNKCTENVRSKSKSNNKNYLTAKKNYVYVERVSKDKVANRPSITGPTLLKNKSFIYTSKNSDKQNYMSRPSHGGFKGPYIYKQQVSIGSIQRKSQDINASIGSSNGDSKQSYSFFNSSQIQDSSSLKDSYNSNKLDKTLNFSRKSNQTMYRDIIRIKTQNDSTSTFLPDEVSSSLCPLSRQVTSSFDLDIRVAKEPTRSFDKNSINFSKKFHNLKKPRQTFQSRIFTINDFQFIEQMGQGKYGKVLMAKHKDSGFICAIKTISKQKIKQQNIQQPLLRQIKIQLYLDHPNIVKLYGLFHDRQNLYLIMECCVEGHLLKLIKQRKIFQENQILQIISNVYEAASFLHCHGIIHRDIKPQNIVIQHGVHKLCDFGWAAYTKGDTRTTFCGTPLYVCPEVLKGNEYDSKADVWGLGVLTYQLSYGRVPFPIWSQADMLKIVKDPVYFPTWTGVSDKMQNLIKSMLNKDPNKRPSLNQILSSPLMVQYINIRPNLKCQIETLF